MLLSFTLPLVTASEILGQSLHKGRKCSVCSSWLCLPKSRTRVTRWILIGGNNLKRDPEAWQHFLPQLVRKKLVFPASDTEGTIASCFLKGDLSQETGRGANSGVWHLCVVGVLGSGPSGSVGRVSGLGGGAVCCSSLSGVTDCLKRWKGVGVVRRNMSC